MEIIWSELKYGMDKVFLLRYQTMLVQAGVETLYGHCSCTALGEVCSHVEVIMF